MWKKKNILKVFFIEQTFLSLHCFTMTTHPPQLSTQPPTSQLACKFVVACLHCMSLIHHLGSPSGSKQKHQVNLVRRFCFNFKDSQCILFKGTGQYVRWDQATGFACILSVNKNKMSYTLKSIACFSHLFVLHQSQHTINYRKKDRAISCWNIINPFSCVTKLSL